MSLAAAYIDSDTFTVVTDKTVEFCTGRRVKCNCGADGYKHGTVTSSSYSAPNTTVNLSTGSDNLTSNLTEAWYGIISDGSTGSVPIHAHLGNEGDGGPVSYEPADATILKEADVDDVPVDAATVAPVSSNWAFDHDADANAHHAESHPVASHSDTTATGAELETLTNGSNADTLHTHAGGGAHTITSHSDVVDATGAQIEELTGGGDTTLHDHDGISENTAARHTESHTIVSHSDTTVTGAELNADHSKLTGIESSAKDDQTASEVPIVDAGTIITATEVEGALQENRTAIDLNTAKVTNADHTGEVTGDAALTIADNAVTNAKLANVATATIKGRATAATGDPEDLTAAQVRTLIGVEDGAAADQIASEVTSTPSGNVAATDVQSAINELDTEKAPIASPTFTGTVTLPADPTTSLEASTKSYVDQVASGLDVKTSCRVASVTTLPANTAAGSKVGKTLTVNAVGILTVDGVNTVLDDRILVKDEATGGNNGVYKVTTEGTAGVAAVLTRATDFDQDAEVTAGAFTFIEEGTANADNGFVLTTNDPITVDTTALSFTQFSGGGAPAAHASTHVTGGSDVVTSAIPAGNAGLMTGADKTKIDGIEALAEVNNISDVNATDLTDAGDSTLHYHATDRARANHTGTQAASTISDFDTEVANNVDVVANTAKLTNATHTGEVTGSGALSLDSTSISNKAVVTAVGADHVLIGDASDAGALKRSLISDFASAGGDMAAATYDPTTIASDAFAMDNMVEGATTKILTNTERSEIAANTLKVTNADHTGEVTGSAALTIAADAVTYAKMQDVSATDRLLGRVTAGAGNVEEITCTAAGRAILDDVDAAAQRTTLSLDNVENLQVKLDGTAAPVAATDDITLGYSVGSRWFDITNDKEYVCLDNADGAAVWIETTGAGGGAHTITSHSDIVDATGAQIEELTGGGDTVLHDHDGISENTAARHIQGTDTALGTMAADINMNSLYQVVNLQAPAAAGEAIRQTTNITEANLETLTDNSVADTLHRHSELVASDGSPDPALSVAADGKVSFPTGTGINEFSTDGTLAGDSDDAVPTEKAVATAINTKSDNILINQDFSIWQRNTTFTNPASDVYTADMYSLSKGAGSGTSPTINIKKNTSVHETAFDQSLELEITNVGVGGAGRAWALKQAIPDFEKYKGKTVTASIRLKSSTAINISGTGSLFYIADGVGSYGFHITSFGTNWVTLTTTGVISSSATLLHLLFGLIPWGTQTISTTGSIYIQWMKLELGSVATPLIPKSKSDTLLECMPFYQKSYAQGTFAGAATQTGSVSNRISSLKSTNNRIMREYIQLHTIMKATPTITLYDIYGAVGKVYRGSATTMNGTVVNQSDSGFSVWSQDTNTTTEAYHMFHWVAVASP